ncbi:MAG: nicotinate phosphoribosyltransferase [Bacilli bacterium]|nr:nicotinate phosphoribosyltransferase [Bacilli bacterium]
MNNNEKLIDLYELTMAYTDFKTNKKDEKSVYDVFFRRNLDNGGYNVVAGLEEIIDYIKNIKFDENDIKYLRSLNLFDEDFLNYLRNFKFTGDIYAVPTGTIMFPGEPCITVIANQIEAKIIETDILNKFNHSSLIATKSRRIKDSAKDKQILEFGARRAHGKDAAIIGAKSAYISGCEGTSCYEAGKKYKIPLLGTMAHSLIMEHDSEYEAFLTYAKNFPNNTVLLVDTIDTLNSGVPNAIKVAKEYLLPNGYKLKGIRLDSGDLAYLSKEARKMLDEAGLHDTKICVSNSLDEYTISDLLSQGSPIDSFGVGENLITSKSTPVFGGVYKLASRYINEKEVPTIKLSDNVTKITNPGLKKVIRFYDKNTGFTIGDTIALKHEEISEENYTLMDETHNWKRKPITNYIKRELQIPIFKNGKLIYKVPTLNEIRQYAQKEFDTLYPEAKRFNNPHIQYVTLSPKLLKLKRNLIEKSRENIEEIKGIKKELK